MAAGSVEALFAAAKNGGSVEALFAAAKADSNSSANGPDCAQMEEAIMRAAKAGDPVALKKAIEEGREASVSLDCANGFDGNTPLHWAVEKGYLECVQLLCSSGAQVDSRERWQRWTPLMVAASKDRLKEAEVLLAHGADTRLNARGMTAAQHAATPEMRELLARPAVSTPGPSSAASPGNAMLVNEPHRQ